MNLHGVIIATALFTINYMANSFRAINFLVILVPHPILPLCYKYPSNSFFLFNAKLIL